MGILTKKLILFYFYSSEGLTWMYAEESESENNPNYRHPNEYLTSTSGFVITDDRDKIQTASIGMYLVSVTEI